MLGCEALCSLLFCASPGLEKTMDARVFPLVETDIVRALRNTLRKTRSGIREHIKEH